jgi:heptaprenyl diphosphate synthase
MMAHVDVELGLDFDELSADVANALLQVRDRLWTVAEGNSQIVNETARHLLSAGGKLLRPLLTILGSMVGDGPDDRVITGAVVCELTHLASLYHDDVIDGDEYRRGVPSANARWGNNVAILAGDYLLAAAAHISLDLGNVAQNLHAETARRMVSGQIHEAVGPGDHDDPIEHYLMVASDKTASLISASVQLGAILVGALEYVDCLARFGENLGIAFQIANDMSDLQGGSTDGRGAGSEFRFGVPTLPVIYARAAARSKDQRLIELLDAGPLDAEAAAEATALMRHHKGYALAQLELYKRIRSASDALRELPEGRARRALLAVTQTACNPDVVWWIRNEATCLRK